MTRCSGPAMAQWLDAVHGVRYGGFADLRRDKTMLESLNA